MIYKKSRVKIYVNLHFVQKLKVNALLISYKKCLLHFSQHSTPFLETLFFKNTMKESTFHIFYSFIQVA